MAGTQRQTATTGVRAGLRRWSAWVAASGVAAALAVAALNLVVDPYQVFNLVHWRDSYSPNEWLQKFDRVLAEPGRYNAFLVGSSRMGLFDPGEADRLYPGTRFYNLSKFAAAPSENLAALQALARAGVRIERLLIGIDLYPFLRARPPGDPAHFPPPALSGQSVPGFYAQYLFLSAFQPAALRLAHHWAAHPDIRYDFTTGEYFLPGRERQLREDPQAVARGQLAPPPAPLRAARLRDEEFAALAATASWARGQGIAVQFFIHPHHRALRGQLGAEGFARFRASVQAATGGAWDFSEVLDASGADAYYDLKHYRRTQAAQLMRQLAAGAAPVGNSAMLAGKTRLGGITWE